MVQSNKKSKDKKKLASSHNKSWIWGRHAVMEILEAGRWPIHELYLSDSLQNEAHNRAQDLAETLNVRIKVEPADRLRELARTSEHQGYLAKMKPYPYAGIDVLTGLLDRDSVRTVLVVLDRIQDPHNFGAIVRSAEVLGIDGIVIGDRDQADVTPAVARASAGAVNHIPIVRVDALADTVRDFKKRGVRVIAASEKGESLSTSDPFARDTSESYCIVLGNEGEGISDELLELSDTQVRIQQLGRVESLNVAAAAAILLHEATRAR